MNDKDYLKLEQLLSELRRELKHRYCIIPDYIGEGVHIGIYDDNNGHLKNSTTNINIKEAVKQLKKQHQKNVTFLIKNRIINKEIDIN